jgi:CBS domain containing-hemolysin-like protein
LESYLSAKLNTASVGFLHISDYSTVQQFLLFSLLILIILLLIKIGQKILLNILDSDEDSAIANMLPLKTGQSGNVDMAVYVADIFMSVLLASVFTSAFIYLFSIVLAGKSLYLLFIISILSGFVVFWLFDYISGILSTIIVRNSRKPGFLIWSFMFIVLLSYPFRKLFERSIKQEKIIKRNNLTYSDLSEVIESSEARPEEEQEKELMKGVLNFSDLEVKEIMKSRVDVVAFQQNALFSGVMKDIAESGYSRFPVYGDNLDSVIGILHIKDILSHLSKNDSFKWMKIVRPALFVPENLKINELLKEFQLKKSHMAVVVDEYVGTSGIVTLEDIIEEIVGEIDDEFDEATDGILYDKISDNEFVFDGKTSLNDFCKIISYPFDELEEVKGDAESLAGLILSIEGKFPERGSIVKFDNILFQVTELDNRRIKQVKVMLNGAKDES